MPSSDSKLSGSTYYHPIPTDPPPPQTQYIIVLPYSHSPLSTFTLIYNSFRRYLLCFTTLFLLSSAVFLLFPSDPEVSIARLHLERLKIHTDPKLSLDITLNLTIKLRNKDFYSIDYNYLLVSISYRGKQLGFVTSDHGLVKARASSYVNATLQLDDVEIFADVIPLIEDLAKGSITFNTVTEIGGQLGLSLFEIPLKAKVSCEVIVNTRNQSISHQNCYPETEAGSTRDMFTAMIGTLDVHPNTVFNNVVSGMTVVHA